MITKITIVVLFSTGAVLGLVAVFFTVCAIYKLREEVECKNTILASSLASIVCFVGAIATKFLFLM